MQEPPLTSRHSTLKDLILEASRALSHLDANRLEELALACQTLNRDVLERDPVQLKESSAALAHEASEAQSELAIFGRVLEATRANLAVMNRLRELREGRLEYGQPGAHPYPTAGGAHGND